jgi:hypothetical protein
MPGRGWNVGLWGLLLALVLVACGPAPLPSLTPPPLPSDAVPWADLTWELAEMPPTPGEVEDERIVAAAADGERFVAVGYREANGVRDGAIWSSVDGSTWFSVDAADELAGVELLDVAAGPGGFVALGVAYVDPEAARPQAVFLRSEDGTSWERLPAGAGAIDAYPTSVAGGADRIIAAGFAADGGPAVWAATDTRSIDRVPVSTPGVEAIVDPRVVPGEYLALGSSVKPPVLLRSTDAQAWTAVPIDPAPDVVATELVLGRWGWLAIGLWAPGCSPMASCAGEPIAWWSGDGRAWGRLPRDGSPLASGSSIVVPAGDHGLLALDGANAWASADGWVWRQLPEPGDGTVGVADAVVRGDTVVAVGQETTEDGIASVGRIIIGR